MFKWLGKLADERLEELGLERRDLRYHFGWRGRRYYIPPFNLAWWIVTIGWGALILASLSTFVIMMCLLGG